MFGEVVGRHRRRLGLSQEDLAARSGVSVRGLRKIESGGVRAPRPSTVRLLADALGLAGDERSAFIAAALAPPAAERGPAQLPMDVSDFTGRVAELGQLDTGGLTVISGTAGVGKTALAVYWAHRVRPSFPDGQLYVDLRGYDPDRPVEAGAVLGRFLTALGVAGADIPLEPDERAARYRTETSDRRLLIVLDNAASAEQVRPLLPGSGHHAVLVTSRDSLGGLVAMHGGRRVDLDLLPGDDALTLLRRLIGPRVDVEPDAAAELAGQCARLPLALRLAAELAATKARTPLRELVVELADQQALNVLDGGGDARAALRGVFSWSVRHLPPGAARTFALLGLHPGPDIDVAAAAALTGADRSATAATLTVLARASLLQNTGDRRYTMHDLLRAYARDLADAPEVRPALRRLFDYYRDTAAEAVQVAYPAEWPRPAAPTTATTPEAAMGWLDTERLNLTAMAEYTARHDWPADTVALSTTLYRYLARNHQSDAFAIHAPAVRAARQIADPAGLAQALLGLGMAHMQIGQYESAAVHLDEALAEYGRLGDRHGEARALSGLGVAAQRLGRYPVAAEHLRAALAGFEATDDPVGEARALTTMAVVDGRLGRHDSALLHARRALTLFRRAGHRAGEAHALNNLAIIEVKTDRFRDAIAHLRRALTLFRRLGDRRGEAGALEGLGGIHAQRSEHEPAIAYLEQALTIFRQTDDRYGEAWTLNSLGEAALGTNQSAVALDHHAAALAIAANYGFDSQHARAHAGIAAAQEAAGRPDTAREHYTCALTGYAALSMPEADAVRARLRALDRPRPSRAR